MRRTAWVITAAVTVAVVVLGGARMMGADRQESDERGRGKECSEATIRGDYGIQIQGTRPAPGRGAGRRQVARQRLLPTSQ